MNAHPYTKLGNVLFTVISAPVRYVIWQFDLDDSKEKPSLLKMICVAIAITTLLKMSWPMGWPEFLTLLCCILGIASRKSLEKFADKIGVSITGSATTALSGDLAAMAKEARNRALPNLRTDNESGGAT